ncbi:hypothetical protein TI04_00640 [Achromatium sp. WMS2]|nr:hypothetical protein TI04_00640 [Achromatium sp. WMS2]
MRIKFHELNAHIRKPLLPVYLVTGDEPLQHSESVDLIRKAAVAQGYVEREILEQDSGFSWHTLINMGKTSSLFGDKRLIDFRLSSIKIGNDGSAAVSAWASEPPTDTILLISGPKLERPEPKWVQKIDACGGVITVLPVAQHHLAGWLLKRFKTYGLSATKEVADWLAEQVEGNLLAGAQELEKLALIHGTGTLTLEQVVSSTTGSSRYNVFELSNSMVDGNGAKSVRILRSLCEEGINIGTVLWVVTKDLRVLAELSIQIQQGIPASQSIANKREIFVNRHSNYIKALERLTVTQWQKLINRCTAIDRAAKGMDQVDPWMLLERVVLGICGFKALID